MIGMRLSEAGRAVGGNLLNGDVAFTDVATDTRGQVGDCLFVALKGERFDAHEFAGEALEAGAVAVMAEREMAIEAPQLLVPDTRAALGALAQAWRGGFCKPLVAITGSNGKTTVKEMVASILRVEGRVHATHGNLNNEIGVPKTLFGLGSEHDYAVVEMGANHPGEIEYLVALAQPDAALITNAGPAHLEGFGSLDGVASSKGEIFAGLPFGAIAVINFDDPYAGLWLQLAGERPVMSFAMDNEDADVRARILAEGADTRVAISCGQGEVELDLPLAGKHNVLNAAAATALCLSIGADLTSVKQGLESVRAASGRVRRHRLDHSEVELIDDTYNANPASVRAAIALLADLASKNAKPAWLVLGDMAELGEDAPAMHAELGRAARESGIRRLMTLGPLSGEASAAFGEDGEPFEDHEALARRLLRLIRERGDRGANILVKGSRSAHMEDVVTKLLDGHLESKD